mgnify:CR=1 FL=1
MGIVTKHDFKGGKARYEELSESHHDHLIDIKTGEIVEFVDQDIENLQKKIAKKLNLNVAGLTDQRSFLTNLGIKVANYFSDNNFIPTFLIEEKYLKHRAKSP